MNSILSPVAEWSMLLSRWSLLASAAYVGLLGLIVGVVLPAGRPSVLPEKYLELVAAAHRPRLYRLSIGFDILAWIALSGFLISWAGLLSQRAPIKSLYIAALAVGLVSGLIGAGLRLVGTPDLASRYHAANASELKSSLAESYSALLGIINTLFNIGGILAGIALVLVAFGAWSLVDISHWILILLGLSGILAATKGGLELITGRDLGPLALSGNVLMIVSFLSITLRFW